MGLTVVNNKPNPAPLEFHQWLIQNRGHGWFLDGWRWVPAAVARLLARLSGRLPSPHFRRRRLASSQRITDLVFQIRPATLSTRQIRAGLEVRDFIS